MHNPLLVIIVLPLTIGFAMGAFRYIQRKGADLRGHRLPPMGMR